VSGPKVDRCICFDKTFVQLKEVADRTGARSVPELQRHVAFGKHCTLCVRYVEKMLASGDTEFPLLPLGQ
jgi:bacterioferritin-associated ferredoxin